MASLAAILLLLLAGALPAYATDHVVGGNQQWGFGVNYGNWASAETFKVGDTLLFEYPSTQHDVVEVSQSDYNSCSSSNPIKTYTDGNTSITLDGTNSRYFICGYPNHCSSGGMKVSVAASGSSGSPSTPSTPPPSSGSPAPPTPSTSGPSSQPPPPPPPPQSSGAVGTGTGFYSMKTLLSSALLMGVALVC